mgnify:CR=1 FL=1
MISLKIFVSALVVLILLAVYLIVVGYWPTAFVNYQPIYYKEFQTDYLISHHYYQNSLKASGKDPVVLEADEVKNELKRAVLESLIGERLIDEELNKIIKSQDLSRMIEDKIDKNDLNSENFKKGSEMIYGLSPEEFKKSVLVPKAKEEILEGRLISENNPLSNGLDGWLKEKKSRAKIIILLPGFGWNKGEVEIKK